MTPPFYVRLATSFACQFAVSKRQIGFANPPQKDEAVAPTSAPPQTSLAIRLRLDKVQQSMA